MCQLTGFGSIAGPGEISFFDTFGEEQKNVAFPDQPLNLVRASSTEQEERIRDKQGQMVFGLDEGSKGIDAIAHVGESADHINCSK